MKSITRLIVWLYLALALAISDLSWAAQICRSTFTVTKTSDTQDGDCSLGDCSLREAVIAANTCAGPNTIVLRAGTYRLSILETNPGNPDNQSKRGDLDITDKVTIRGAGPMSTIIDGGALDRIIDLRAGTLRLEAVTLRNGRQQPYSILSTSGGAMRVNSGATAAVVNAHFDDNVVEGDQCGGAIENNGALQLTDVVFTHNSAPSGGGGALCNRFGGVTIASGVIANSNSAAGGGAISNANTSTMTLSASRLSSNTATSNGGAISSSGYLNVLNTELDGNTAQRGGAIEAGFYSDRAALYLSTSWLHSNSATAGPGGAIDSVGNLGKSRISNTLIEENQARGTSGGGGGISSFSPLEIRKSTIRYNSADHFGGALMAAGDTQIFQSTFYSNQAELGGGVFSQKSVSVFNCTFDSNTASNRGAGLNVELGEARVKNSTFSLNGSTGISGVFVSPFASLRIGHSILWGAGDSLSCIIGGSLISFGYNIDSSDHCHFTAVGGHTNTDPGLETLADLGGARAGTNLASVANFHRLPLMSGSPSRNGGASFANSVDDVTLPGCSKTDARGKVRPLEGRCDTGAIELDPVND